MDSNLIKQKIAKLVEDFKVNHSKYKHSSEADVETKLIEPLFEALGWDKSDFVKQEKVRRGEGRGRADYALS
jgi:predicted type IV restriction endonuclease